MGSRMASRLLQAGYTVAVGTVALMHVSHLFNRGAATLALEDIGNYPVILTWSG